MTNLAGGAPRGAVVVQPTARDLAGRYAGAVVDLDGVCYLLDQPVDGAPEGVAALRGAGLPVVFATNNAERTPLQVAAKLSSMGIAASGRDVVTSALAAAEMVAPGTRCLVLGTAGLAEALTDRGAIVTDDHIEADTLVVGLTRELVWEDLRRATVALARGVRFLGTNADVSLPVGGEIWPGNGAILAALSAATGREPEVAGKPRPPLFEASARRLPEGPLLMIGDRVETDIAGASTLGWDTLLVLSGVTDKAAARAADPRPTYVLDSLASLVRHDR